MKTLPLSLVIKTLRMERQLPQKELARRIGVSQSHLSLIEDGRSDIKCSLLEKIADSFDVEPSYLFSFTDLEGLTQNQSFLIYKRKIKRLSSQKKYTEILCLLQSMENNIPAHAYIRKYILRQKGLCHLRLYDDAEAAIAFYQQGLKVRMIKPESSIENAKLYCEIGYAYHYLKKHAKALTQLKRAASLLISARQTRSDTFVYCCYLQSLVLQQLGKLKSAMLKSRKGYHINGNRGSLFLMAEICTQIARLYYLQNDLANCSEFLNFTHSLSNLSRNTELLTSIRSITLLLELALLNIRSHDQKPLIAYTDEELLNIYAFYYQNNPDLALLSPRQLGVRVKQKKRRK